MSTFHWVWMMSWFMLAAFFFGRLTVQVQSEKKKR